MRAYNDIELAVAKTVKATEPVIFNCGSIHGGVTNNIICDHCTMFCTLRTWSNETGDVMLDRIKRICAAVAETADGSFEYTTCKQYPIVYNSPLLSEYIVKAAAAVVGKENIKVKARGMGGEDFSYFAALKPGYMFRLGIRNEERGITVVVHNDRFDIDEDALEIGVRVFTKFILDNMNGIKF